MSDNYRNQCPLSSEYALAELDPKTVHQLDETMTNLLVRIVERTAQVGKNLAAAAGALPFDAGGNAVLTNWVASVEGGHATMNITNDNGKQVLRIRLGRSGSQALARWESRIVLPPGHYRFAADVKADQLIFRGPTPSVTIGVWGVSNVQLDAQRPSRDTMKLECVFSIDPLTQGEHVLQCQAKGIESIVEYRFESLSLTRLP